METPRVKYLGNLFGYTGGNFSGNVYATDSLSPTLNTMQGGNKQPMIVKNANPTLLGGLGEKNYGKQYRQGNRVYGTDTVSMCITSQPLGNTGGNSYLYAVDETQNEPSYRIRKLTPRECYRLMGFDDEAFDRAESVNSNTQLYKQAGNSIVVDVLVAIFDNLLVHSQSVWLDELLRTDE